MNRNYTTNKATMCVDKTCTTVYGNAAKAMEVIAVTTTVVIGLALMARALK